MSWIMVRADFDVLPPDLSPYIDVFRSYGVENTLEDDRGIQGCVVEVEGSEAIIEGLKSTLLNWGATRTSSEAYVEQDWEISWKQFFKPRRIGKRIVVIPTWEQFQAEINDIKLLLDPGQAFGTGDHPTTRLCLELLERHDLNGKRVADVGCGSGILAIAAVKLGANVVAVDIDPVALEVAKENAARNEVTFETYCGDGLQKLVTSPSSAALRSVPQDETPLGDGLEIEPHIPTGDPFDVLISNIISATLIRLAVQFTSVIKPGGHWIVSGIIEDNWPEVQKTAEGLGLTLQEELHEDGWVAADFKKS